MDWIVFYKKANDSLDVFEIIYMVTTRLNSLSTVTMKVRTIDLVTKDLEVNKFYGDDFYYKVHGLVSIEYNNVDCKLYEYIINVTKFL